MDVSAAVRKIVVRQKSSGKPLAIVLAGHNGAGKSTMWYEHLAPQLKLPLINADRMMLSVLPDVPAEKLPKWATALRDKNNAWMGVAQKGVQSFVAQAMAQQVPFATETVFSYWEALGGGTYASKIDTIKKLQEHGYFVLLLFVGLGHVNLSIARVASRRAVGGHDVPAEKLLERFPRTQKAIHEALKVVDAAVLVDNSFGPKDAFRPTMVQISGKPIFDLREQQVDLPLMIRAWMQVVCDGQGLTC